MKIREATVDDLRFLIEAGRDSLSAHWSEKQYRDLFEGASGDAMRLVLVAEQDGGERSEGKLAAAGDPHVVPPVDAADNRSAIAGFLVARHVAAEWELENIVVRPEARRNRLGTQLLTALIDVVRNDAAQNEVARNNVERNNVERNNVVRNNLPPSLDNPTVFLEVRESNSAARALYKNFGFRETGRRKSYYAKPLEDAILYRLTVR